MRIYLFITKGNNDTWNRSKCDLVDNKYIFLVISAESCFHHGVGSSVTSSVGRNLEEWNCICLCRS